jgi:hypothetical protein
MLSTLHVRSVVTLAFCITWLICVGMLRPALVSTWRGYLWRITMLTTMSPMPFRTLYAPAGWCPLWCCSAPSTPLLGTFHTVYIDLRPLYNTAGSVSIISTSNEHPHLVDLFRQWTYYPKAPHPWRLTKYGLQVIEMGMMVTNRGNLKERIPRKALIRLNRQPHGTTSSVCSPCKAVYGSCHFFILVCLFSHSLCFLIYFPILLPLFLCSFFHFLCTYEIRTAL